MLTSCGNKMNQSRRLNKELFFLKQKICLCFCFTLKRKAAARNNAPNSGTNILNKEWKQHWPDKEPQTPASPPSCWQRIFLFFQPRTHIWTLLVYDLQYPTLYMSQALLSKANKKPTAAPQQADDGFVYTELASCLLRYLQQLHPHKSLVTLYHAVFLPWQLTARIHLPLHIPNAVFVKVIAPGTEGEPLCFVAG